MSQGNRTGFRAVNAVLCLAFGAAALVSAEVAVAQTRRSRGSVRSSVTTSDPWRGFDDFGLTLIQLQRESIATQEEQAREVGRRLRREEVGQLQEKEAAERAEYFDSLIEASRAALRAPRGIYYRKPGFVSADQPGSGAASLSVGGMPYLYDRGIFLLAQGTQYVAVTAPVGAVVDALPAGAYPVSTGEGVLHYFFGTFFSEQGGKFEVVVPPPGAIVSYLPDGYAIEKANGSVLYRFGSAAFKPVFSQGVLVYRVVAP